jgi:cysteine desulfurase
LHQEGEVAKQALDAARIKVASLLHAKASEVYFTSGGTEALNIAIDAVVMDAKRTNPNPHVIVSMIEHPAALEKVKSLISYGVEVSFIAPNEEGIIRPETVEREIKTNTVLVVVMHANNEIGTIQPVQKIAKVIKERAVFLVDASQSALYEDISIERLGADMLVVDGIKMYGPRGVGALVVKDRVELAPSVFGGG